MRSLLAVTLVAASASAASAGTYLGLGIGTSASPSGGLTRAASDGNRSGRLMLGTRFGRLSVEGAASRYSMNNVDPYQGTMLAGTLKYSLPMGNNFEIYGRGGIQRTWLSDESNGRGVAGTGWVGGAGFEYRLNLGLTAASLFVDYEHSSTTLANDAMTFQTDEAVSMWTLGATLAL